MFVSNPMVDQDSEYQVDLFPTSPDMDEYIIGFGFTRLINPRA